MAKKKFTISTPEEVEKIFSTVDDTGHTNEERAKKQRLFRKIKGVPREIDPLSNVNPAGEDIEKLIRRTALIFVLITLLVVVVAQVSCGVARRAITANLTFDVSYDSVYRALDSGVEWGDGFTQFPDDFKVIEANERTHRVEVSVINTSTDNELDCFAASSIQSTAFAVNALLNPDIDTVVFHVDVHQNAEGLPQKSAIFGFLKPSGEVKRFMTFVWTKHATENGINFTSSITGADPAFVDKLQKQLNMTFAENIFGVTETKEASLYKYKTDSLENTKKIEKIVSSIKYGSLLNFDSFKVEDKEFEVKKTKKDTSLNTQKSKDATPEKVKEKVLSIYLSPSDVADKERFLKDKLPDLRRQTAILMALIPQIDRVQYCSEQADPVEFSMYTKEEIQSYLQEYKLSLELIGKSQSAFTEFITVTKN